MLGKGLIVSRCTTERTWRKGIAYRCWQTLITANAGDYSEANLQQLHARGTPALVADGLMQRRDERFQEQGKYKNKPDPLVIKTPPTVSPRAGKFRPRDFHYDPVTRTCCCPAGKTLYSNC